MKPTAEQRIAFHRHRFAWEHAGEPRADTDAMGRIMARRATLEELDAHRWRRLISAIGHEEATHVRDYLRAGGDR